MHVWNIAKSLQIVGGTKARHLLSSQIPKKLHLRTLPVRFFVSLHLQVKFNRAALGGLQLGGDLCPPHSLQLVSY